jgi:formyl-CoA transferase
VPHEAFQCKDKRWLAVGVVNDEQWRGLCAALDRAELADDERFATNPQRVRHRDVLIPILRSIFEEYPAIRWVTSLRKTGVPNAPLFDFATLREHEHVLENEHLVPVDVPHQGQVWFGGVPWKFARTPARLSAPPSPGQHTDEIRVELGLAPRETTIRSERDRSGSF